VGAHTRLSACGAFDRRPRSGFLPVRGTADVTVAYGHQTTYVCWDHATELLERGGVILGANLG